MQDRLRRGLILAIGFCLFSGFLAAKEASRVDIPWLIAGQIRHGQIDLDAAKRSASFRISVNSDVYALRLSIKAANADLDLVISDLAGNELWTQNTPNWNETIQLSRMATPSLETGEYLVKVNFSGEYRPAYQGQLLSTLNFDLNLNEVRVNQYESLSPGIIQKDVLTPDSGMQRAYRVIVPSETKELRIDVFGSQTDTDLYGQARVPFTDPRLADFAAQTWRSRETLIIPIPRIGPSKFTTAPADAPISVYFMILSELDTVAADYWVLASLDDTVPSQLQTLAPIEPLPSRNGGEKLTNALQATVEIITDSGGGSGCVISPDGWILTNYHVVRGNGDVLPKRVSIGFTQDVRYIPDTQFWAELVAEDERADLALLHIVSGFYRQSLPTGYSFPYMKLYADNDLRIGDMLYFTGYPTIGGLGDRATITCTEGIVSGFQTRGGIDYIKTAAMISSGNSGGAALDTLGRLIGIPTMIVGNEASQIAYVSSIGTVPAQWLKLAGIASNSQDGNSQP